MCTKKLASKGLFGPNIGLNSTFEALEALEAKTNFQRPRGRHLVLFNYKKYFSLLVTLGEKWESWELISQDTTSQPQMASQQPPSSLKSILRRLAIQMLIQNASLLLFTFKSYSKNSFWMKKILRRPRKLGVPAASVASASTHSLTVEAACSLSLKLAKARKPCWADVWRLPRPRRPLWRCSM